MSVIKFVVAVCLVSVAFDLLAGDVAKRKKNSKKSAASAKSEEKALNAELKRMMRKRERALEKYGRKPTKRELAEKRKNAKIDAECGKMMRERIRKLNARLKRREKGKLTKKEREEGIKERKIRKEIVKMMKAREKHLASGDVGKLTAKEKRQVKKGLKYLANAKDDHKTGDQKAEENTNKFDGDIDIDPDDDWDVDPELFGD